MNSLFHKLVIGLSVGALTLLSACSEHPMAPEPNQNNNFAKVASTQGAEVFRSVQTLAALDKAAAGPKAYGEIELPAVGSFTGSQQLMAKQLEHLQRAALAAVDRGQALNKANGDTLIFDFWWSDPQTGIRYHTRAVYDSGTGLADVTIVADQFPPNEPLARDSTYVLVFTNFTLEDTADDVVERLANRKDYRATYRLQFEEGQLVPDEYAPGIEPTGGIIDARRVFNSGQDTTEAKYRLEYHESSGGSFSESASFEDGSSYEAIARFTANRVTFDATYRDGASEHVEITSRDENNFSFTKTRTFAPGSDPRSIFESGAYSRNPADSSVTADFAQEIVYADGRNERHEYKVKESQENGFRRVEVSASNSDGTSLNYTLQAGPDKNHVAGNAVDKELRYLVFDADFYHNGSARIHLEVFASKEAFDRGHDPIFVADLVYRPDGSGSGTVTSNEGVESFRFGPDGNPSRS